MSKKNKHVSANLYKRYEKLLNNDNKYPDWYWKRGLHDAEILSIDYDYAKLVLTLNSNNAIYERVNKIIFREYKIMHIPEDMKKIWWMCDKLDNQEETYTLKINVVDDNNNDDTIVIQFQKIEVIRP